MTRLNDDRISYISHNIFDRLSKNKLVDPSRRGEIINILKDSFMEFDRLNDAIEEDVKKRIRSMAKEIPENSQEWKILYAKNLDQELKKKGLK